MGPILLGLDHVRACTGRYSAAWSGMQQTIAWLDSVEQVRYRLIAYDYIAYLLLDPGLPEAALEEMEHARELARSTGIEFWHPNIEAHAAIASTRLGARDGLPGLERILEQTLRTAERYLSLRCLEAIAEAALAQGKASRALAAAGELFELAEANGLREVTANARRWRGEALAAANHYDDAMGELTEAAALAREVGRVRLRWDVAHARARLHDLRGETRLAQLERAAAKASGTAMAESAATAGLAARLQPDDAGG